MGNLFTIIMYSTSLIYKLHKVVWAIDKLADRVLQQEIQITYPQFLMLMAIARQTNVSQRTVADFLDLTPGAVSRHSEILRERGLLLRQENRENRREHRLLLTTEGEALYKKAKLLLEETCAGVVGALGESQQESLNQIIEVLQENFSH